MKNASKLFVVLGCLLILAGVIAKLIPCANPAMMIRGIRPVSFIILANTSFLLAILLKK